LVLVDDVVVGLAAAVTTATLVVLSVLLSRYRALVKDSTKSSDLAKNLWDAMNARLITQDTRIVDLMAKVEVYSVRSKGGLPAPSQNPVSRDVTRPISRVEAQLSQPSQPISQPPSTLPQSRNATKDTDAVILRALMEGPKTPNQIRDIIGMTREHTGRLMKLLFTRGLVVRNDQHKPYIYEATEAGRRYVASSA
jgi:DNA-binding MarR family transcriptional regulator